MLDCGSVLSPLKPASHNDLPINFQTLTFTVKVMDPDSEGSVVHHRHMWWYNLLQATLCDLTSYTPSESKSDQLLTMREGFESIHYIIMCRGVWLQPSSGKTSTLQLWPLTHSAVHTACGDLLETRARAWFFVTVTVSPSVPWVAV